MAAIPTPTYSNCDHIDATCATPIELKPGDTASTWDYLVDQYEEKEPTPYHLFSRKAFRKLQRMEKKRARRKTKRV